MEVLFDLIMVLVLSRVFWKFVGSALTGMQKKRAAAPPRPAATTSSVHMERDPVCGTFVVPERAVTLSVGREHVYFCSAACRDQYRAKTA
jgi:YHS domain-containing protein